MSDRVFIVHGWDGFPEEGWFPWLKKEIEAQGAAVFVPQMPHAERPTFGDWVPALSAAVGTPDERAFFVGHSIGCQTILRYLESLPMGQKVGGVVLVAPFLSVLTGLSEDDMTVAKPWLETPIDFSDVRRHAPKSVCLFSDDDQFVPLENETVFKEKLGCRTEIFKSMGHFSGSQGVTELPAALDALRGMMAPRDARAE